MTFKELNISAPILRALANKNYTNPTPIQEQAIPVALNNRDLLGIAQTGTGKTAAFSIPLIQQLDQAENKSKKRKTQVLILTPTRELAIQIEENIREYSAYTSLRTAVIFGGVRQRAQVVQLMKGVDILIATPGRLLDLIGQHYVKLDHIKHFVLDEADRMLDMGFIKDINKLLPMLPKERQTLFFSATMPKEIAKLSKNMLNNPERIEVASEGSVMDTIDQQLLFVKRADKTQKLISIIKREEDKTILIFSRTKRGADRLARTLNQKGIECEAMHGDKTQNARQKALRKFKQGRIRVIVATDMASRGIDIKDLGMVINYDLPDEAETYVHRIGRTGRAGNSGVALSLCANEDRKMLRQIQKLTGRKINALSA